MRNRRGHSLIECLVTIGLIGMTLSIVAVAMSQMRRSCQRVGEASTAELELERFSFQLRTDAHRALSAKRKAADGEGPNGPELLFTLADRQRVKYTLQTTRVERLLYQGDEVRHRDSYGLPKSFTGDWELRTDRSSPLVSLKLEPGSVESVGPMGYQSIQIDAAVGLLPSPRPRDES
jgi:type II secretory pathway pseudopilin PulG